MRLEWSLATELRTVKVRIIVIGRHAEVFTGGFATNMKQLIMSARQVAVAFIAATVASALAGCVRHPVEPGMIDRTFTVNGPVQLELTNGGGDSRVTAGPPGRVTIHAEFHLRSWSEGSAQKRASELRTSPPFSQDGNMIRVGGAGLYTNAVVLNYTIAAPPETAIHAVSGYGKIEATGFRGPVTITTGSGEILASNISGDIQVHTGSGTIQFASIQGQVQATTGSGDINCASIHGDIRVQTGSGVIRITSPAGPVVASAGSGSVNVSDAMGDLRLRTSAGNIGVAGDPQSGTYWDFRTSSGNVGLQVSPKASFRFYAKTNSGEIDAAIPVVMEGTAGKHALRARIGDGKGRVEVETSSGNVALH
jgi:hypothetical protein